MSPQQLANRSRSADVKAAPPARLTVSTTPMVRSPAFNGAAMIVRAPAWGARWARPDVKTAPRIPLASGNREPRTVSPSGPVTAATRNSRASASCRRIRLVSVPADSEA